jgi:hypothetical protein
MGCATNENGMMTLSLRSQRDEGWEERSDYDYKSGLRLRNGSCRTLSARNRNLAPNLNLRLLAPQFAARKSLAA